MILLSITPRKRDLGGEGKVRGEGIQAHNKNLKSLFTPSDLQSKKTFEKRMKEGEGKIRKRKGASKSWTFGRPDYRLCPIQPSANEQTTGEFEYLSAGGKKRERKLKRQAIIRGE